MNVERVIFLPSSGKFTCRKSSLALYMKDLIRALEMTLRPVKYVLYNEYVLYIYLV